MVRVVSTPNSAVDYTDAVGLERVEGEGDLLEALVDIRQRQHGEQAEAAGMIGHQLLGVFVRLAREAGGRLRVAGEEIELRRGRRADRRGGAALVHVVERFLHRPVVERRIAEVGLLHRVEPGRRRDVVMHVDALRRALRRGLHPGGSQGAGAEHGGAAGEKIAPRQCRGAIGRPACAAAEQQAHGLLPRRPSWRHPDDRRPFRPDSARRGWRDPRRAVKPPRRRAVPLAIAPPCAGIDCRTDHKGGIRCRSPTCAE